MLIISASRAAPASWQREIDRWDGASSINTTTTWTLMRLLRLFMCHPWWWTPSHHRSLARFTCPQLSSARGMYACSWFIQFFQSTVHEHNCVFLVVVSKPHMCNWKFNKVQSQGGLVLMSFAMRMVGLIFFTLLRFHATCSFGLIWLAESTAGWFF
jgi:hypothetical protein